MRLGIIDLGTNSVRFDVVDLSRTGQVKYLHREKLMIRLGQDVFLKGKLDPGAVRRTIYAFQSFERTSRDLKTNKVIAFGTSAVREATDVDRLLSAIRSRTGIDVRVISGEEEARLISLGVLANERIPKKRFALIDIGGGSTEINICRGKKVLHRASFPLGTARLQQIFLKTTPPRPRSIEQLRAYVREILLSKMNSESWPLKVELMLGSSGTIRAIARVFKRSKKGKKTIERNELKKLVKAMGTMTTSQLLGVPGLEPKRVDMILAGAVLVDECMDVFKCKKVETTEFSLRDGILEEERSLARHHMVSHISLHLPDFYAKAKKIGVQEVHLKQVVALSLRLFDGLRSIHRLGAHWRAYLEAAAILHDSGEVVSAAHHSLHSYYIVKNSDFPTLETWESEFIAQLCLHHAGNKLEMDEVPFEKKQIKQAFIFLLAILRVADALDRGHKGQVVLKSIEKKKNKIILRLAGKKSFDLELLRVEQKRNLFEKLFKKELEIHVSKS